MSCSYNWTAAEEVRFDCIQWINYESLMKSIMCKESFVRQLLKCSSGHIISLMNEYLCADLQIELPAITQHQALSVSWRHRLRNDTVTSAGFLFQPKSHCCLTTLNLYIKHLQIDLKEGFPFSLFLAHKYTKWKRLRWNWLCPHFFSITLMVHVSHSKFHFLSPDEFLPFENYIHFGRFIQ